MAERKLEFPEVVFGTLQFPVRYFIVGYILVPEKAFTTTGINNEIRDSYPAIWRDFFEQRSKNYAYYITKRALRSLGLAEKTMVEVSHPTHGSIQAQAFRSTDLVDGIESYVHYWWGQQLEHNLGASAYLAHFTGSTLDGPYNRSLLVHILSSHEEIEVGELSQAIRDSIYTQNESEDGLEYHKIFTHLKALERLNAVKLSEGTTKRTLYSGARVNLNDTGRKFAESFVNPLFRAFEGQNQGQTQLPKKSRFDEGTLYRIIDMYYPT